MVVHLTKFETAFEKTDDVLVYLLLGDESLLYSLWQLGIGIAIAALHVGTGDGSLCGGMELCGRRLMGGPEVGNGTTIADNHILKAPFIA